jgi:uncharacterized protein YajQ (UPF0234 family)
MRKFKVDKKYTHFAINKATNKVVNGWDYKGVDNESIKYYSNIDLKDNDQNPKDHSILTKATLIRRGIDPMNWDKWQKIN